MASPGLAPADFQALFEQLPDRCLVVSADPRFIILEATDAYLAATRTQRESILGRSLFDIFPDNPDEPDASGVANLRASLLRVLERRTPDTMPVQRYDVRRPASEGGGFETRHWLPHNTPVLSRAGDIRCVIHHVEDITALMCLMEQSADGEDDHLAQVRHDAGPEPVTARSSEARDRAAALVSERAALLADAHRLAERQRLLADSQRRAAELEAVINSIPDAVYVGDATGIKRANQPALDLLGYDTVAALNQHIAALGRQIQTRSYATGQPLALEEQVFSRALQGDAASMEVVTRHLKTGRDVVVRSSAAPIVVDHEVVGAVAINVDITDRVKREEELRARSDFEKHLIGIVSHDLRSPLTAVIMTCQSILRREDLDERQRRPTLRILSASERAARMISDLLDFTKARLGGGIPVQRARINLHGLVSRTVEEVQAAYGDRDIVLAQRGDGEGEWDADRVAQVVTNLLRNALAYSPPDTPVRVVTEGQGGSVTLSVHNEGEPIPPDKLAQLFEPLQRATAVGAEGRSVGLGLYIVHAVVVAHGGSIEVESNRDAGTTFTMRLPRQSPSR